MLKQRASLPPPRNAQNGTGTTALHMAKAYAYDEIAQMLLAAGADGNITNNDGNKAINGIDGDK